MYGAFLFGVVQDGDGREVCGGLTTLHSRCNCAMVVACWREQLLAAGSGWLAAMTPSHYPRASQMPPHHTTRMRAATQGLNYLHCEYIAARRAGG